jgi:hypothetical protein
VRAVTKRLGIPNTRGGAFQSFFFDENLSQRYPIIPEKSDERIIPFLAIRRASGQPVKEIVEIIHVSIVCVFACPFKAQQYALRRINSSHIDNCLSSFYSSCE